MRPTRGRALSHSSSVLSSDGSISVSTPGSSQLNTGRLSGVTSTLGVCATNDSSAALTETTGAVARQEITKSNARILYFSTSFCITASVASSVSALVRTLRRIIQIKISYTHLRAHETDSYLVCRLLLEKKK